MKLLEGRHGLIVGIANERSLAYGIAKSAHAHGAKLALTYQNERLKAGVDKIGQALEAEATLPCDVTDASQIEAVMQALKERWGKLDFVIHAVAAAKREELNGRFVHTSRDGFAMAMDVSVYSLISLSRAAESLLVKGKNPSILTLTYYASQKAMPNYNVMGVAKAALEASVRYLACDLGPHGVRVNALSSGPVKTLSAAGVRGLRRMLTHVENASPLRRNVTADDVGDAALWAISDLGRGMTGEVFHIDAGYHVVGATGLGAADA